MKTSGTFAYDKELRTDHLKLVIQIAYSLHGKPLLTSWRELSSLALESYFRYQRSFKSYFPQRPSFYFLFSVEIFLLSTRFPMADKLSSRLVANLAALVVRQDLKADTQNTMVASRGLQEHPQPSGTTGPQPMKLSDLHATCGRNKELVLLQCSTDWTNSVLFQKNKQDRLGRYLLSITSFFFNINGDFTLQSATRYPLLHFNYLTKPKQGQEKPTARNCPNGHPSGY